MTTKPMGPLGQAHTVGAAADVDAGGEDPRIEPGPSDPATGDASIEHFAEIQARHEEHRRQCEVRFVANLPSNQRRREYLEEVSKARGINTARVLRSAVWDYMNELARNGEQSARGERSARPRGKPAAESSQQQLF